MQIDIEGYNNFPRSSSCALQLTEPQVSNVRVAVSKLHIVILAVVQQFSSIFNGTFSQWILFFAQGGLLSNPSLHDTTDRAELYEKLRKSNNVLLQYVSSCLVC